MTPKIRILLERFLNNFEHVSELLNKILDIHVQVLGFYGAGLLASPPTHPTHPIVPESFLVYCFLLMVITRFPLHCLFVVC